MLEVLIWWNGGPVECGFCYPPIKLSKFCLEKYFYLTSCSIALLYWALEILPSANRSLKWLPCLSLCQPSWRVRLWRCASTKDKTQQPHAQATASEKNKASWRNVTWSVLYKRFKENASLLSPGKSLSKTPSILKCVQRIPKFISPSVNPYHPRQPTKKAQVYFGPTAASLMPSIEASAGPRARVWHSPSFDDSARGELVNSAVLSPDGHARTDWRYCLRVSDVCSDAAKGCGVSCYVLRFPLSQMAAIAYLLQQNYFMRQTL